MKTINISLLFWMFLALNPAQGQKYDNLNKCIITKSLVCNSNDNKGKKTLYISGGNLKTSRDSITSANLKGGLYYDHPLAWDISNDSLLFIVRMHEDHTGITYTDLRKYNLNKLSQLTDAAYKSYIEDNKRMITKNIPPLFTYSIKIGYEIDTLKGPIYYDIICDRDSFFLFIYINDTKMLEKWNFVHYPLYSDAPFIDAKEIQKKNAWEKVASYPIGLNAPFRMIQQKKNLYLFTADDPIYSRLDGPNKSLKKLTFKKTKNDMIVIDKEKAEIRLLPLKLSNQPSTMQSRQKIVMGSTLIKL